MILRTLHPKNKRNAVDAPGVFVMVKRSRILEDDTHRNARLGSLEKNCPVRIFPFVINVKSN